MIDLCPRCKLTPLIEPKARYCSLSRRDNETYICDECGTEEALVDAGFVTMTAEVQKREDRMKPPDDEPDPHQWEPRNRREYLKDLYDE